MARYIVTAIILIVIILLFQIDNGLKPEAKEWLSNSNQPVTSRSYIYLLGIDVNQDDNPMLIGGKIYDSIKQYEEDFLSGIETNQIYTYPQQQKFLLEDYGFICELDDKECMEAISSRQDSINRVIQENQILLDRYNTFLSFNDFKILAKPLVDTPMPAYHYLSRANYIYLVQQILLAKQGNHQIAIDNVRNLMTALRSYLASANTMVSKMVFTGLLSNSVDALWIVKNLNDSDSEIVLENLTDEETEFQSAIKNEFRFLSLLYQNLDKHPEFMQEAGELPGWSVRLMFKPNMTTNLAYDEYNELLQLSNLDHPEFAKYIENYQVEEESFFSIISVRNPIGNILHEVAKPDLKNFIGRIRNLSAKISIFNDIELANSEWNLNNVRNPYYPEQIPPMIIEQENKVCFNTPLESQQMDICFPVL